MIKDIKYISKRIIIGVGIALLLMLIKGSLIGNVYALEDANNVQWVVPTGQPVVEYSDSTFFSNFATNIDVTNPTSSINPSVYFYGARRQLDSPNTIVNNYSSHGPIYNHATDLYASSGSLFYDMGQLEISSNIFGIGGVGGYSNFELTRGNTYSMLIEIHKSSNATFYSNPETIGLHLDTFYVRKANANNDLTNITSYIDISSIRWLSPNSISGGDGNPNLAYIELNFSLNSVLENTSYYFDNVTFSALGVDNNYASFIFNTSSSPATFRIKSFSFIENGYIVVSSLGNELVGATPGMDVQSMADFEVFSGINTCESPSLWDISSLGSFLKCEFENLIYLIKAQITRIGNFFTGIITAFTNLLRNLFVPDLANLSDHFEDLKNLLTDKFGFMSSSFNILTYFKDSFLGVQSSDTISFPGVTIPIWDVAIIPSFTYSFSSILSNEILNQAHNVLYIVLNGLVVLGFIKFCYNNIMEILGGFNNDIG